jgi:hypothetical protein
MKVQTSLRLDKDLIASLREEATKQRRSLNNLIETMLYKVVNVPNEQTKQAIHDAHNNIGLTPVEDYDKWRDSLLKGDFDV